MAPATARAIRGNGSVFLFPLIAFFMALLFLTACSPLRLTRPITKIGLVAPFEGKQRAIGYEALYAAKLAVRENNLAGGTEGWLVELVALDDGGQTETALRQARALAVDHDVMSVIGVMDASGHPQARSAYARLGLSVELVDPQGGDAVTVKPSASFDERYRAISGGAQPGALAVRVYSAMQTALAHIEQSIRAHGRHLR